MAYFLAGLPSALVMITGLVIWERRMARMETKVDLLWRVLEAALTKENRDHTQTED